MTTQEKIRTFNFVFSTHKLENGRMEEFTLLFAACVPSLVDRKIERLKGKQDGEVSNFSSIKVYECESQKFTKKSKLYTEFPVSINYEKHFFKKFNFQI